jgi:dipeptidyl aminopeptidase/acylaminoacyl peptidase
MLRTAAVALLVSMIGVASAAPAHAQEPRRLDDQGEMVWAVAFSPDGRRLLTGGGGVFHLMCGPDDFINVGWGPGRDFAIRLWDVETGKVLQRFEGHTGKVSSVAFSPDGGFAVSGAGDNTLRLWDVETGHVVRRFAGHTDWVTAVAFSADGSKVLSGSRDRTVRLWDARTGEQIRSFEGHPGRVWDVALSPDGTRVASCGDEMVARVWDAKTGKELRQLGGHTSTVVRICFSPDGRLLLTGAWDHTARLWAPETGREVRVFTGHTDRVEGLAFTPDGRRILTGSLDKTVRLWDAQTAKALKRFEGHTAPVTRVAVSPDGRLAASGSWDNTARLWRVPPPVEPTVAWQVFPDAFRPDAKLEQQVMRRVADLDAEEFVRREEAMVVLAALGEDALPLLLRVDPETLSEEQKRRLARLTAGHKRVSADEAAALRRDPAFLLDCLESDHAAVRKAAAARLREVAGEALRDAGFDPEAEPPARHKALAALRQKLPPPTSRPAQ